MGGQTRHPREICHHCRRRPCRKVEHIFCSPKCAKAAQRKVRPLCCVCHVTPASRQSRFGTCGKICSARLRWSKVPQDHVRAWAQKAADGRRRAFLTRMAEYLRTQMHALDDAPTTVDRAKILTRIYQKGRHDQSALDYHHYVVKARRPA